MKRLLLSYCQQHTAMSSYDDYDRIDSAAHYNSRLHDAASLRRFSKYHIISGARLAHTTSQAHGMRATLPTHAISYYFESKPRHGDFSPASLYDLSHSTLPL
jgi:hypothetical protein